MEITRFDIADYLDSKEMITEYLNTVLEEGSNSEIITAIGNIAKAIGMTKIAEQTATQEEFVTRATDKAKEEVKQMLVYVAQEKTIIVQIKK